MTDPQRDAELEAPMRRCRFIDAGSVDVAAMLVHMKKRRQLDVLASQLHKHWDTPKRWPLIRKLYSIITPDILAGRRRSPYGLGLENHMTPIEVALWDEIRCMGMPFYMQYPVGRRFVGFGDPVNKLAIEADGAAWHSPEKDAQKDHELGEAGWTVYRVKGRDTFKENALQELYIFYGRDHRYASGDGE